MNKEFITQNKLTQLMVFSLNKNNNYTFNVPQKFIDKFNENNIIPILSDMEMYEHQTGYNVNINYNKQNGSLTSNLEIYHSKVTSESSYIPVAGPFQYITLYSYNDYVINCKLLSIEILCAISEPRYNEGWIPCVNVYKGTSPNITNLLTKIIINEFQGDTGFFGFKSLYKDTKIELDEEYSGTIFLECFMANSSGNKVYDGMWFVPYDGSFINILGYSINNVDFTDLDYSLDLIYFREV